MSNFLKSHILLIWFVTEIVVLCLVGYFWPWPPQE